MLDFEAALARAEAADRRHPRQRGGPDRERPARPKRSISPPWREAATRSGNLAIPLVKALTANVAKTDAEAARYVHWGATSQDVIDTAAMLTLRAAHRCAAGRYRPRHRRLCQAGTDSIATPRWWRAPGCSMRCRCRSDSSLPNMPRRCIARARGCSGCAARRWRCSSAAPRARWPRSATRDWLVAEKTGAGARSAAAGGALAHPSRPHRGGSLGAGDPRRHLRQDRPRRVADDADRCRRGVRALGRRPRRLLDHAAQAQSGRGRDRARRGHHGAQSGGDDFRSAGAGPRTQRRAVARGMADLAEPAARHLGRARGHRRYRRRPGSRCRADARQSRRHPRADHGRSRDDGAGRKDRQERGPSSGGGREQKGRRREKRPARRAGQRLRRSPRISTPKKLQNCSSRWPIRASRRP